MRPSLLGERKPQSLRVATWNLQSLFPIASMAAKWGYLADRVRPDVALLTEATGKGHPAGLRLHLREGGLGPGRRWGSIVAVKDNLESVETSAVTVRGYTHQLYQTWPGSVVVADIGGANGWLLTVVGVYAPVYDRQGIKVNHGYYSAQDIARDLQPLFATWRRDRILVAGDFNMYAHNFRWILGSLPPLVDLVEATRDRRPGNFECDCLDPKPCPHIWTHRNKACLERQQMTDYMVASPALANRLTDFSGGPGDFPGTWDVSDHAPLLAEFELEPVPPGG